MSFTIRTISVVLFVLFFGCKSTPIEKLRRQAEKGDPQAMYEYGVEIWRRTKGEQEEVDEATSWISKAAEKGNIKAMYELGCIWEMGGGPSPKAVHWFNKGADAGDPNCMGKLAEAYRYGYLGLKQDEKKYRYWMDKAMAIDREREKAWSRR